jgi:hypothetical protein
MGRNKIIVSALFAVILISTAIAVSAQVILYFIMPMAGTIPEYALLSPILVNKTTWTNGTTVSWGNLASGSNSLSLDVYNSGNVNLSVSFYSTPPLNWVISYSMNNTVVYPSQWLNGTITLVVPQNETARDYSWNSYLEAKVT